MTQNQKPLWIIKKVVTSEILSLDIISYYSGTTKKIVLRKFPNICQPIFPYQSKYNSDNSDFMGQNRIKGFQFAPSDTEFRNFSAMAIRFTPQNRKSVTDLVSLDPVYGSSF